MAITRHTQSQKMQRCEAYVRALEQERTKIQFFQRELPLSLQLVTRAIESCKQQLSGPAMECDSQNEQSESSEPKVLEEFVPIPLIVKKPIIDGEDGKNDDENGKKSDWLRSVQLWNQTPDQPSKEDDSAKKVGVKRDGSGGAFHPFKKEKSADIVPPRGTVNNKEENEGPSRKSRRCWSPQLHKRFLQALQELGGSHVATPKQIRDLMNVEGLTNDEVKSHLQKYRLHTRRHVPSSQNTTAATAQAPQFVVVTGGLWMPPEYTVAVAAAAASREAPSGIFAPIASLPPPFGETSASSTQQQRSNNETSDSNIRNSRSPATSSSVYMATASLAC